MRLSEEDVEALAQEWWGKYSRSGKTWDMLSDDARERVRDNVRTAQRQVQIQRIMSGVPKKEEQK